MTKRIIALILIAALAVPLAGCAGMSDREKTIGEGVGAGAIVGGILGAIVGGKRGAVIGAALGAAGGAAVGVHVANQKQKYASTEQYLDACIASAQQTNQQTMAYNANLENDIKALDAESNRLLAQYKKKKVQKAALVKERGQVQAKLKEAKAQLAKVKNEINIQQKVLAQEKGKAPAHLSKLQQELEQLRKTAAELEQKTSQLASIDNRMNV